jgi:hypothetical protein
VPCCAHAVCRYFNPVQSECFDVSCSSDTNMVSVATSHMVAWVSTPQPAAGGQAQVAWLQACLCMHPHKQQQGCSPWQPQVLCCCCVAMQLALPA